MHVLPGFIREPLQIYFSPARETDYSQHRHIRSIYPYPGSSAWPRHVILVSQNPIQFDLRMGKYRNQRSGRCPGFDLGIGVRFFPEDASRQQPKGDARSDGTHDLYRDESQCCHTPIAEIS